MPHVLDRALLVAAFCVAAVLSAGSAFADTTTATVVPACGNGNNGKPLQPGTTYSLSVDPTGVLCSTVIGPGGGGSGGSLPVTIVGPDGPEGGVSVSINPYRANAVIHSGSFSVGGAWQQIAPENLLRQRFFIQNYCSAATEGIGASESLFVSFMPNMPAASPLAAAGPVELLACGSYDTSSAVVGTSAVWMWAATTSHRFVALEW